MGLNYSADRSSKVAKRKMTLCDIDRDLLSEDLDMYLARQIARNLREYDLEQKIDLEIKMREGTTKLLAACKHPNQSLEAAKSLLTSNERMNAYMNELQKRKAAEKKQSELSKSSVKVERSKARVSISDIRMPLIWKDTDHFKNKGDYRRFAVFCLLRIGTEIYDTVLLHSVDRSMTDITFDDVAVFHHIPPDFEFKLEVYCRVLQDDLSIASTPRKLKKKISSSVSRTFGRKVAASLKDEFSENGPKFDLIAEATLKLKDAHDSIRTHDLLINSENGQSTLPLFGHFCCRLAVNPDCINEERLSGFLKTTDLSEKNEVTLLWASLKHFKLFLWKTEISKAKESKVGEIAEAPHLVIAVNKSLSVKRQNSLSFILKDGNNQSYAFSVLNKDDLSLWITQLEHHRDDYVNWQVAAEQPMEIPSPSPNRVPMFFRPRVPGSLYDEIPLLDSPSKMKSSNSCIGISPSFSFRSRSSSISSSGTGSTSTSNSLEKQLKRRSAGKYILTSPSSTLTKSSTNYSLY